MKTIKTLPESYNFGLAVILSFRLLVLKPTQLYLLLSHIDDAAVAGERRNNQHV